MADYSYMHGGSTANGKSRLGPRFQSWDNNTEQGWSTPSIITKTEVRQDHVCRPVIVGPDGTIRPGVVILPQQYKPDGIVSKTETVVEHVYPAHMSIQHAKEEAEYGWGNHAGHYNDQPSNINDFITSVQPAANGTDRTGMFQRRNPNNLPGYGGSGTNDIAKDGWSKPSSGTYDMDTNGWSGPSSGIHDTSTNGWGRPSGGTDTNPWGRPRGGTNGIGSDGWSKPSSGTYDNKTNVWGTPMGGNNAIGTAGWSRPNSKPNDFTTNGWSQPTGTTTNPKFYDGSYGVNELSLDEYHTPTMTTTDAWGKPSRVGWSKPSSYESNITKPTSNIGAIVDYVKDSARPPSVTTVTPWKGRFSASSPTYSMNETITEISESKEDAQRYGSLLVTPFAAKDRYAKTIDSKEAVKKYNGVFV